LSGIVIILLMRKNKWGVKLNFKLIVVIIFVFLIATNTASALSATIGNAKMVLRPEITPGKTKVIQRSILIKNVNEYPVQVTLTVDPMLKEIITMPKSEYTLQADEQVDVPFTIRLNKEGLYDGKIYVLFKPGAEGIADSPVGLTSHIVIITKGYNASESTKNQTLLVNETTNVAQNQTKPVTVTEKTTTTVVQSKQPSIPNIAVGIIVVAVIVIIGGIISYLIIRKVW